MTSKLDNILRTTDENELENTLNNLSDAEILDGHSKRELIKKFHPDLHSDFPRSMRTKVLQRITSIMETNKGKCSPNYVSENESPRQLNGILERFISGSKSDSNFKKTLSELEFMRGVYGSDIDGALETVLTLRVEKILEEAVNDTSNFSQAKILLIAIKNKFPVYSEYIDQQITILSEIEKRSKANLIKKFYNTGL